MSNKTDEKPIVYEVTIEGKILESAISQIGQVFKEHKFTTVQGLAVTKTLESRIIQMLEKEELENLRRNESAAWLN